MAESYIVNVPRGFYDEMTMSEVDTQTAVELGGSQAHLDFARTWVDEAVSTARGYRVTLTEQDAIYFVENIEYHTDRWQDLGEGGTQMQFYNHIRTGRRVAHQLSLALEAAGYTLKLAQYGVWKVTR